MADSYSIGPHQLRSSQRIVIQNNEMDHAQRLICS
jgi:hypothetical protein